MSDLQADLHAHLAGLGRDQQLYLPRANESPLRMTPECLDTETADIIAEAYRADLEAFPGRWDVEKIRLSDEPWTADGVGAVIHLCAANERIGDLSRELHATLATLRQRQRPKQAPWVPEELRPYLSRARRTIRAWAQTKRS
jgi:hypothetical protein